MKLKWRIVCVCALVSASSVSFSMAFWNKRNAPLFFEPPFVNVGEVEIGQTVVLNTVLYNRSKSHLTVKQVQTSCSCTVVDSFVETQIPPGGSAPLKCSWKIVAREGATKTSLLVRVADVSGEVSSLPFYGKGVVMPRFDLSTSEIVFEGNDSFTIMVSPKHASSKIADIVSSHPAFTPILSRKDESNACSIAVAFDRTKWFTDSERGDHFVKIDTTDALESVVRIPIVVDRLRSHP